MPELVERVETGFANALNYDKYRPSYPQESVRALLKALKVYGVSNARILDLGAGTGKLTEQLSDRPEKYDIVAVDPLPHMLAVLDQKRLPGVRTVQGTASTMSKIADGWADAVVVAQAFHWFANIESLKEIHRVLKPGGGLGLIWNLEDYNSGRTWKSTTIWEDKLKEIIRLNDVEDARAGHKKWQDLFERPSKAPGYPKGAAQSLFSVPVENSMILWTVWMSKNDIWNRYKTLSQIASLDAKGQEEMKQRVFNIMDGPDVEKNAQGELALHGRTETFWTYKLDGLPSHVSL